MMEDSVMHLRTVFGEVQSGARPSIPSKELANMIYFWICRASEANSESSQNDKFTMDIVCLCLTLVEKVLAKLSSRDTADDATLYHEGFTRQLFEEMDAMTRLVVLFSSRERLLSHQAAKCASSVVICNIYKSLYGGRCAWREACSEMFQKCCSGNVLDACLWSLTAVVKGVLKGDCECKPEVLGRLLPAFDPSLATLYSNLLQQENPGPHSITALNPIGAGSMGTSLCAFMDLLEVLAAARLRHGVLCSAQRLLLLQSRALLDLLGRPADALVEPWVRKRVVLLLKRLLLQRPGEDWGLGQGESQTPGADSLQEDMCVLVRAVLQEVDAGWLQALPVKAQASSFSAAGEMDAAGEGRDDVTLRAISLILLKCLEYQTRSNRTTGDGQCLDIRRYLGELLAFLQRNGTPLGPDAHHCSWITLVFSEQDDDLMEAVKASVVLFQRSLGLLQDSDVCVWGSNPHCHFALLLRSVTFDPSVLLDFLISSETCFLEYCVRYLRHLRDDWQGFLCACAHIEGCEWSVPEPQTPPVPAVAQAGPSPTAVNLRGALGRGSRPSRGEVSAGPLPLPPPPPLVEYGSSEDSEEEEQSAQGNTGMHLRPTDTRGHCSSRSVYSEAVHAAHGAVSLREKAVMCLAELRTVVHRLHQKNLFPYDPSSLLKLLMSIEDKSKLDGYVIAHTSRT